MQNVIIKGKDNPVIFTFNFTGDFAAEQLASFDRITVQLGAELYDTSSQPSILFLVGSNQLRLKIGDTTQLAPGGYTPEIIGYSADYDDGYLLTGAKRRLITPVIIV